LEKMDKNVCILVKKLTSGGAEKQSVLLAKALANNYNVHYVVFNAQNIHKKYLDMLSEVSGVRIKLIQGSIYIRFYSLIKYLKENSIGVIFSYLTAANFFACFSSLFIGLKIFTGLRNSKLPLKKRIADRFF